MSRARGSNQQNGTGWPRWQRCEDWLFAPVSPLPLAAFRIAFGVVLLFRFFTLCLVFDPLFTPSSFVSLTAAKNFGVSVSGETVPYFRWSLFFLADSASWARVLFVLYGASIIALLVGWRTRLISVLVFILTVSLHRREPVIWTGGDTVIQCFTFWLMFTPSGAALSADAHAARDGVGSPLALARRWMLLLLQAQLALVYLSTFLLKLSAPSWIEGTAMRDIWRLPFYARPWSALLIGIPGLATAATWGTMLFELVFPLGVWSARLRPWLLAAGLFFHLAIELTLRTGTFTWAMLACYVPFLSERTLNRILSMLPQRPEGPGRDLENVEHHYDGVRDLAPR